MCTDREDIITRMYELRGTNYDLFGMCDLKIFKIVIRTCSQENSRSEEPSFSLENMVFLPLEIAVIFIAAFVGVKIHAVAEHDLV